MKSSKHTCACNCLANFECERRQPETEVIWICRNFHGKTREINLAELMFWRIVDIWNLCVAWPGGTKHTKRRKCPLLGKSRVLPTHCRMCTAPRLECRFRHQPLRRRRSESARSPPLCTLPLVPAGEIEGRPNQPFYDHIYFTRMAWHSSRASVFGLWLITSATFYGEVANGLDSIWQSGR